MSDHLNLDRLDNYEQNGEDLIDETTRQIYLARQFIRFDRALKLCKSSHMKKLLEKYKQETLQLMRRY